MSAAGGALCHHSASSWPLLLPARRSSLLMGPDAPQWADCLLMTLTYSAERDTSTNKRDEHSQTGLHYNSKEVMKEVKVHIWHRNEQIDKHTRFCQYTGHNTHKYSHSKDTSSRTHTEKHTRKTEQTYMNTYDNTNTHTRTADVSSAG